MEDWLWGISHVRPVGDSQTIVDGDTEAEELRLVGNLVTWKKDPGGEGGAGITAKVGKWKNVEASFPLHNQSANREFLRCCKKKTFLAAEDLDKIRALFGEKVGPLPSASFYFYFSIFLFPIVYSFSHSGSSFLTWDA